MKTFKIKSIVVSLCTKEISHKFLFKISYLKLILKLDFTRKNNSTYRNILTIKSINSYFIFLYKYKIASVI